MFGIRGKLEGVTPKSPKDEKLAGICLLTCCPEKTREPQVDVRLGKHRTIGSASVPILVLEERKMPVSCAQAACNFIVPSRIFLARLRALQT